MLLGVFLCTIVLIVWNAQARRRHIVSLYEPQLKQLEAFARKFAAYEGRSHCLVNGEWVSVPEALFDGFDEYPTIETACIDSDNMLSGQMYRGDRFCQITYVFAVPPVLSRYSVNDGCGRTFDGQTVDVITIERELVDDRGALTRFSLVLNEEAAMSRLGSEKAQ